MNTANALSDPLISEPLCVNKHKVANGFDKAATRYTSLAVVQSEIAGYGLANLERLIARDRLTHDNCNKSAVASILNTNTQSNSEPLKAQGDINYLLDIGCGPASASKRQAKLAKHVIGLDISFTMLQQANLGNAANIEQFSATNSDAESLPFQSNSIDIVYSSMALQWCSSPQKVLREVQRVLKPKGRALLCILTGESFNDLHQAWRSLMLPSRINQFHAKQSWLDACASLNGKCISTSKQFISEHESVIDMLSSIKRIGANTRIEHDNGAKRYISKQEILGLNRYFKQIYKSRASLPLCYEVVFLEITP
jgi:malonyl-CoA O-methyltransferase